MDQGEEVNEEPIRREDDFQGWLAQQKAGWRKRREERRAKQRTNARTQVGVCMGRAGMEKYGEFSFV